MGWRNLKLFSTLELDITRLDSLGRSTNVNQQILISFFTKGLMIILNLIQIPITLKILGNDVYGVWLTILSVTSWISMMDIGIGNGLRNKLAESISVGDKKLAQIYISTAYVSITLICLIIFVLILPCVIFLNWQSFFNLKIVENHSLAITVFWAIISTLINFTLGLIAQILNAIQQSSLSAFIAIIANSIFLILIYSLQNYVNLSLPTVSLLYCLSNTVSVILFSILFFRYIPYFKPQLKYFNKHKIQEILTLGGSFFIIQIAVVIIFSTDSFIITQILGPSEVASYNITLRLFNILGMFVGMLIAPLWSAYTDAYLKKDFKWIKDKIKMLNLLIVPLAFIAFGCAFFFSDLITWWLDKTVIVPYYLPFAMALFVIVSVWNNIYSFFLNGISRTKEQMITAIIAMLINLPLCILFAKHFELGTVGIILSTIISLSIFAIVGPIVTYSIINKKNE